MTEPEKEYKPREAAKLLGVHPGTIRNWISKGKLIRGKHFIGPPGRRRFSKAHIEKIKDADL